MKFCALCKTKKLNRQNVSGYCYKCVRSSEGSKAYYADYRRGRKDNPEFKARAADYAQKWRANNVHRRVELNRKSWLSKKFSMTVEQYALMLAEQNNRCGLCGDEFTSPPHVDHDHKTGFVRRIVCIGCNTMLGRVEKIGLEAIAAYLTTTYTHNIQTKTKGKQ